MGWLEAARHSFLACDITSIGSVVGASGYTGAFVLAIASLVWCPSSSLAELSILDSRPGKGSTKL